MIFDDITKWDAIAEYLISEMGKERGIVFCTNVISDFDRACGITDKEIEEKWMESVANWKGIKLILETKNKENDI